MTLTVYAIRLRPDRVTQSVVLHASTVLYECSYLDMSATDGSCIVRNWPGFSAGEELLWDVLAWLNGQGELPSDAELAARLDADNLTAVRKAIAKALAPKAAAR